MPSHLLGLPAGEVRAEDEVGGRDRLGEQGGGEAEVCSRDGGEAGGRAVVDGAGACV
jgi:hypothetical protein